ncbi:MAG: DUF2290 domain-containing protein [Pseudanabaena sp. M135S2SP2A07QC]|jgi:hypothetical protein|uniref:DUF2290 domain-containing protein n=1 Tax=Microcystis sp. M074S1 TaxID=2771126 RepID=UPI00258E1F52|nr:DUF2290 domain-containing protein [Microcystis sp. M074S1]MCA6504232.1 DUF2290 domain-containing protein [Pseudanabaena sp. M090S1SP2A07QC]MCA6507366.1 DUF2290 domain-containing protein [Pseudanabaena sp. M172S2SP2A07QC]MCA6520339.1 DUF2290 domain-containing protein [Pseudanabaena sp. M051S1SP2A07QC]MCA6525338.1 DUF2290 domain-containing protein [Pseudanabaena sp. M179S2SP2A07QC]MCA6528730.1 DUF2290 domain-containing protein [Pseudanabaena sp. M125S2SP2A07QC]MCA6536355.1 DUF2290 domain-con
MSLAILEIGYKQVKKLLKESNLLLEENYSKDLNFSSSKFSSDFFEVCQGNNYRKIHEIALINKDYDFLLKDYSFLQFSGDFNSSEDVYRYAYYEVPTIFPSYEEYLASNDLSYDECGDLFRQDYEQVADEGKLNNSVMPIRYDYDSKYYNPPNHSISHFHFGFRNQIRLPVNKLVTPHAFVSFVIRHIYWEKWKNLIKDPNFHPTYYVKSTCRNLDSTKFSSEEEKDFYLT